MTEGEQPLLLPVSPTLCLITDTTLVDEYRLADLVAEAVAGGVNLVQLREKQLPTRRLLALAVELRERLPLGIPLLVNGRVDVAFAAEADGVHLPADGLPAAAARHILGPHAIIGRSAHSVREVLAARDEGVVDYIEFGMVFPSRSHPGGQAVGPSAIQGACRGGLPILAVGGITPQNADQVIAAGAHGVAVISALLGQSDVRGAAQALAERVAAAWERRCSSP